MSFSDLMLMNLDPSLLLVARSLSPSSSLPPPPIIVAGEGEECINRCREINIQVQSSTGRTLRIRATCLRNANHIYIPSLDYIARDQGKCFNRCLRSTYSYPIAIGLSSPQHSGILKRTITHLEMDKKRKKNTMSLSHLYLATEHSYEDKCECTHPNRELVCARADD